MTFRYRLGSTSSVAVVVGSESISPGIVIDLMVISALLRRVFVPAAILSVEECSDGLSDANGETVFMNAIEIQPLPWPGNGMLRVLVVYFFFSFFV